MLDIWSKGARTSYHNNPTKLPKPNNNRRIVDTLLCDTVVHSILQTYIGQIDNTNLIVLVFFPAFPNLVAFQPRHMKE